MLAPIVAGMVSIEAYFPLSLSRGGLFSTRWPVELSFQIFVPEGLEQPKYGRSYVLFSTRWLVALYNQLLVPKQLKYGQLASKGYELPKFH